MKSLVAISIIFIFAFASPSTAPFHSKTPVSCSNVLQYGAVGDGKTDDTLAFLNAWKEVCDSQDGTPTLEIPLNKTFLLKHVRFEGPCKASTVQVLLRGTIEAPRTIEEYENVERNKWIEFSHINGLVVSGGGMINGNGWAWWDRCSSNFHRLTALFFHNCTGLNLHEINHKDSSKNHISINECTNATLSNLNITAPEDSPNTDGVDISSSTNVHICDSIIATGDDCVAINKGSSYINITNLACGPGHGISVGSLGNDGDYDTVEQVHVKNCSFTRTQNGARIKTWEGGAGYAREIIFEDITLDNVRNPIIIDQKYTALGLTSNHKDSSVQVSNVTYKNIYGTSESNHHAVVFDCSSEFGCTNIIVNGLNITSFDPEKPATVLCQNAEGKSNCSTPSIPCLSHLSAD